MQSYRGLKSKSGIVIAPVRANAGIRMRYLSKLDALIKEMHREAIKEITAAYGSNEAKFVNDSAVDDVMAVMKSLFKRWEARFLRDGMADWFVNTILKGVLRQIQGNFKEAASMRLKTPPVSRHLQTVLKAAIAENTRHIKSIPQRYLSDVERLVLECIKRGKDLEFLTNALEERYGYEIDNYFTQNYWKGYKGVREHAAMIARDQVNKVTQLIANTRYDDLGITKAIWLHSGAGRVPRPTHEDMDNKEFDIKQGFKDEKEKMFVQPGQLINCRCTCAPIVPGFE